MYLGSKIGLLGRGLNTSVESQNGRPPWHTRYFSKIRPKEVFRVSVEWYGIGTCYNNNIDEYGTKGSRKGCKGWGGVQGRSPGGDLGACAPRISMQDGSLMSNEGVSLIAAVAISRSYQVLAWGEI